MGFSKGAYVVVAGDYNVDEDEGSEQLSLIEDFYIHEEFRKGQKMNNDIALVKLKGNGFTITEDIQPICLPEAELVYDNDLNCTISGFGTTKTGKACKYIVIMSEQISFYQSLQITPTSFARVGFRCNREKFAKCPTSMVLRSRRG